MQSSNENQQTPAVATPNNDVPTPLSAEGGNDPSKTVQALGDFYMEDGVLKKVNGYNWFIAALFIVAGMAGGGILGVPLAIIRCSFIPGIIIILVMAVFSTITAVLLGKAWMIMLRMYPVYRTHCRRPYPELGFRACGENMKMFVSGVTLLTQFGVSTTFLLIISKTSSDLLNSFFGFHVKYCAIILAMSFTLLPFILQKSLKDLWAVIVLGMLSTAVAVVLICIGTGMDYRCIKDSRFPPFNVQQNLLGMGVFLFSYGGHAIFPTIQNDMRIPSDFSKSATLALILVTIMNLIVGCITAITYGDSLRDSVIASVQTIWVRRSINFMITLHCFLTFPLMVNPINQEIESCMSIPIGFDVRRIIFRTGLVGLITFTALTIPNFEKLMSLFGGSSIVLTTMVMPSFFYIVLSAKESSKEMESDTNVSPLRTKSADSLDGLSFIQIIKRTDRSLLLMCIIMFIIGIVSCVVSTTISMKSLVTLGAEDLKPCYWSLIFGRPPIVSNNTSIENMYKFNCCGLGQNISLGRSLELCNKPDFDYYLQT